MSVIIQNFPMSKRAAEKRERQLALHEAVRSGQISARDAVRMVSFFPADQKPRLISRPGF